MIITLHVAYAADSHTAIMPPPSMSLPLMIQNAFMLRLKCFVTVRVNMRAILNTSRDSRTQRFDIFRWRRLLPFFFDAGATLMPFEPIYMPDGADISSSFFVISPLIFFFFDSFSPYAWLTISRAMDSDRACRLRTCQRGARATRARCALFC